MKKRIFAVAILVVLAIGIAAGLHKITVIPSTSVAETFVPNTIDPPDW